MRAVVQRVRRASVRVDGDTVGAIDTGFCILLGVGPDDDEARADHLAARIAGLRVFADERGRMNQDLAAAGGAALVVSQFTLYADTSHGRRPSFTAAGPPDLAERLYDRFCVALQSTGVQVATGRFAAHMDVELVNDGPVTLVLTSGEGAWSADAG